MRHIARLADQIRVECGEASAAHAEPLFALLLGEDHRRRMLGLLEPVTPEGATVHARSALALIRLIDADPDQTGEMGRA